MAFNIVVMISAASNGTLYNTVKIGGYPTQGKAMKEAAEIAKAEVKSQERVRGVKCSSRFIVLQDAKDSYR